MPALLEPPTEASPFADLIPKASTDYGKFADLVPNELKTGATVAGQEDFGLFSDLVPKSPTSETEKAVAETPASPVPRDSFLELEKGVSNLSGIPFHESMNALRSLSAGAGKYIFEGLQGFEQNRAKMLANPPSELTKPQGDELILPDGSMMSKEQQDALEQRYHDAAIAQIPDAKAKADYFKQVAENADTSQYVDPELAKTIPARIAHAAGSAGVMAVESMIPFAGIPFMVMHGAMATEAEAKNAGKTDAEAETAGVRSAIGLALFGGASKLAALGVAKLLPDGASSVRTFLTQFVGQEAANETSSRAINAWESAADAPEGKKIEAALNALKDTTLEQSTLNTVYALAHATKASERAPVRPEAAPEPSVPLKATEIPPATIGEPTAPANGMVRLYHGGSADQAGSDFTTSRQYAQGYADKAVGNGKVWYVDVPEGSLKTHDEYGQPMTRVVVPNEIADQAKPIEQAPKAEVLKPDVAPAAGRPPKILVDMSNEDLVNLYHRYRSDYHNQPTQGLSSRIDMIGNELSWRTGLPEGTPFGARGDMLPEHIPTAETPDKTQPQGELNVSESTPMGLGTHTGGDESLGRPRESQGVGSVESTVLQTTEEIAQAQTEPIGVADAIAEIQRRNAPEAIPYFAAKFDPESLMQRPAWVEPGSKLDQVLGELRAKNDPFHAVDVAPIWKTLTPKQRQDLAARGWIVSNMRDPNAVALHVSSDAVSARKFYGMQSRIASRKLLASQSQPAPVSPAEPVTTGIAQRVHDVRASEGRQGEILPGEGVTAEDMVTRGRDLLNAGADPEKIIAGVSAGNAVTGDQMAVLRARHEQFSNVTDQAADALRKTPNDPVARQTYENAFKAETDFAQRIKPAATEWHKVGQSMQGETDIQTGTFTGLRRAFHAITGRDVTPKEAVKLDNTAIKVQKANSAVEKVKSDFSEVVKTATKNTLPKTAAELRAHFSEKFKAMLPC